MWLKFGLTRLRSGAHARASSSRRVGIFPSGDRCGGSAGSCSRERKHYDLDFAQTRLTFMVGNAWSVRVLSAQTCGMCAGRSRGSVSRLSAGEVEVFQVERTKGAAIGVSSQGQGSRNVKYD